MSIMSQKDRKMGSSIVDKMFEKLDQSPDAWVSEEVLKDAAAIAFAGESH